MAGWNHYGRFKEKPCQTCGNHFKPQSGNHNYCSVECGFEPSRRPKRTGSQYQSISGDWKRYFSRLQYSAGRKRDKLTRDDLLDILEKQNYKCALSGVELTCQLEVGKRFWTNASVDRIEAGGSYTKDNVQLVCRGLNSWRSSIPVDEFIWWCEQVVNHSKKESEG